MPKKQKKTKNQFVRDLDHLIELCSLGHLDYAISLAGGLGIFSQKTIVYNKRLKKFSIINHIDNTKQFLTEQQIMDDKITNIGKAMPMNSLIAIIE